MIKDYWEKFKSGTKTMFKEFFNKETNKKQRANMWSFSRLIIPIITLILSVISIITGVMPLLIASSLIAGFGAVTDRLDGLSSRKHKSTSEYGKVLDQITDKYYAFVVGSNVSLLNPSYIIILLGELLIGAINTTYKLKYKNIDIKSSKIGKIKQVPLYISLALGYLSTINPTLLAIANVSVLITFIFELAAAYGYFYQNKTEAKKAVYKNVMSNIKENEDENKEKELVLEKEGKSEVNSETLAKTQTLLNDYKCLKNEISTMYGDKETITSKQKTKELNGK